MENTTIGILSFFGFWHVFLIVIPLKNVARAKISLASRLTWSAILVFVPFIGVVIMHFLYGTGLFHRSLYEVSPAEERARSGTLAPDDRD